MLLIILSKMQIKKARTHPEQKDQKSRPLDRVSKIGCWLLIRALMVAMKGKIVWKRLTMNRSFKLLMRPSEKKSSIMDNNHATNFEKSHKPLESQGTFLQTNRSKGCLIGVDLRVIIRMLLR
jgi:hypothetical protein